LAKDVVIVFRVDRTSLQAGRDRAPDAESAGARKKDYVQVREGRKRPRRKYVMPELGNNVQVYIGLLQSGDLQVVGALRHSPKFAHHRRQGLFFHTKRGQH